MGISFVAAADAAQNSGGTFVTVSVPTGTQNGDVMVAFVMGDNSGGLQTPSGWTLLDSSIYSAVSFASYYRVASSEPSNYTFSLTSGSSAMMASIASYRGAASPPDAHGLGGAGSGTTSVICPSISPSHSSDWLINVYYSLGSNTLSPASGQTTDLSTGPTAAGFILITHEVLSSSGATGTRSGTQASTYVNSGVSVALSVADQPITQTLSLSRTWGTPYSPPAPTLTVTDADTTGSDTVTFQWSTDSSFNTGVQSQTTSSQNCPLSSSAFNGTISGVWPGTWYVQAKANPSDGLNAPSYTAAQSFVIFEQE